nr:MAG TPA: hypothetical protein [Bacteriophage sp.]
MFSESGVFRKKSQRELFYLLLLHLQLSIQE